MITLDNKKEIKNVLDNEFENVLDRYQNLQLIQGATNSSKIENLKKEYQDTIEILATKKQPFKDFNEIQQGHIKKSLESGEISIADYYHYYTDLFNFDQNILYTRTFPKFRAALNIARKYQLSIDSNETMDTLTKIGYKTLIKLFLSYKVLESYINLVESIQFGEIDKISKFEERIKKTTFLETLNINSNKIKILTIVKNIVDNNERNILAYIDKKNNSYWCKNISYFDKNNARSFKDMDLFFLIKSFRNNFVHTTITPNSSSNPIETIVLVDNLSILLLKTIEEDFKKLIIKNFK